ncbi:tumor necrosis factor alpha-induced protein 3-like [Xenia sp. Carnegie-2017]|uniref:tumor necrosis factor alpha-induced protein 3-like n=1 Tax=Xenia sp. Carnegie-2017 TaxID=2897299 RepID=UPI001F043AC1|nr:tumor necrosis factor alpha-induced protein 3-like [Xenia sp. Carnegie-2017]
MEITCSTLIFVCGYLIKTICQILTKDVTGMYRQRWQLGIVRQLEDQNAGVPMDFGVEQWNEDWKKTVALPATPSFYCLEEIHIFALANILRRPILVICANFNRGDFVHSSNFCT